jgi:hypothetical protein
MTNSKSGYQPHFDTDLERGKIGEDLLNTFLADMGDKRFEVKTDYRAWETGNFYIETWQYRQPDESDKKQSGINITQAEYWCFAGPIGVGFIMIKTESLKELMRANEYREVRQPITTLHTNASIGRLVPVIDVLKKIGL